MGSTRPKRERRAAYDREIGALDPADAAEVLRVQVGAFVKAPAHRARALRLVEAERLWEAYCVLCRARGMFLPEEAPAKRVTGAAAQKARRAHDGRCPVCRKADTPWTRPVCRRCLGRAAAAIADQRFGPRKA